MIENGNVPLDNNRAENAIRPFTVGRKNWMHCNTAKTARKQPKQSYIRMEKMYSPMTVLTGRHLFLLIDMKPKN